MDKLPTKSQFLLYQTEDGGQRIEVRLEDETVWLSQKQMSDLFQVRVNTINYHIKEIFKDRELEPDSTIRNYRIVQNEGNRTISRRVDFYNLDMIISVGYRVRSHRGTQFRQWATERLREFIIKGFVLDDERLAEPGGADYFDELLERIRAIRASEKRFYQKVRDIYALSVDYDPHNQMTQEFFATVQNKMLYAVTGKTAAEIIHSRADASKPNMGLTTWKGAKRGRKLTKADIVISKNYLNEEEITDLELLVGQYLDFAEFQARRRKIMYMADWKKRLDDFLELNEQTILTHSGSISASLAKESANGVYEVYDRNRRQSEADDADEELLRIVNQLAKTGKDDES